MVLGVDKFTAKVSRKSAKNSIKSIFFNILISYSAYLALPLIDVCLDKKGKICASLKNDNQLMSEGLRLNKSKFLIYMNFSRL